jgi:NADH-quinone oxidoreductase subunit A
LTARLDEQGRLAVKTLSGGLRESLAFPADSKVLENYLPILIFIVLGLFVGAIALSLGMVIGPSKPDSEKNAPYECGFEAFEDSRMKFDVRYYLVAILFIIFDLEIAFLFPWAVVLDQIGMAGFLAMAIFLGILVIGFVYEWKKGALEWD